MEEREAEKAELAGLSWFGCVSGVINKP